MQKALFAAAAILALTGSAFAQSSSSSSTSAGSGYTGSIGARNNVHVGGRPGSGLASSGLVYGNGPVVGDTGPMKAFDPLQQLQDGIVSGPLPITGPGSPIGAPSTLPPERMSPLPATSGG